MQKMENSNTVGNLATKPRKSGMENEAQWTEIIEFSSQIHEIAEAALKSFYGEDAEETLRLHLKIPEIFLSSYKTILSHKNMQMKNRKDAVQLGLQRLKFTAKMLEGMRKEIETDRENMKTLAEEARQCSESIRREKSEIVVVNKKLEEEEMKENEVTAASRKLAEECEANLAAVMPTIEAALKSLDLIKPAQIADIKSAKNPPAVLKTVIAAICVMLQIEPEPRKNNKEELRDLYWAPAKKMLADANFMRKLRDYDKDNIPEEVMDTLRKEFYSNPDFEPARVARASKPAESLCRWVIAMEKYDKMAKEILRPKKQALEAAKLQLGETMKSMKTNKSKLTVTEKNVTELVTKLEETEQKKKESEEQLEIKNKALDRAAALVDGLKDESQKWQEIVEDYRNCYRTMVGDTVYAAGIVTYLGTLPTHKARREVLSKWSLLVATSDHKSVCSPADEFSLHKYMEESMVLETWKEIDFPQDPLWLDNISIAKHLVQIQLWPLCIDPLGIVNKWIKKIANIVVVKQSDEDIIDKLKQCTQSGEPLLLEDITEKLDDQLENLLTRKKGKSTQANKLIIGESEIPINKAFKFYMTSRLRITNPMFYFAPDEENDLVANFSLINFIPPEPESLALQHALLSGVVAKEKKKLEAERLAANAQACANRRKFAEISDKVLTVLSNSKGGRLISIDMTLAVLEARKPLAELQQMMKNDEEAMKKIENNLNPFRKLTIKLAKTFCEAGEEERAKPFSLESFVKKAL